MSEENKPEEQNTAADESAAVENTTEQAQEASAPLVLNGMYGFKKGMSSIYNEKGERVPVTVLECQPWTVSQVKTQEKDGYTAIQVAGVAKKGKNALKAEMGHYKKAGIQGAMKYAGEIRQDLPEGVSAGQKLTVACFEKGQKVKVTSKSKGKGFSGPMKRYGFGGGPASHGSGFHRRPGSIGNCEFPGRVQPGRKMAGQYGNKPTTVKGLEIVEVLSEQNVLLVKGAVPGAKNSLVKIVKL